MRGGAKTMKAQVEGVSSSSYAGKHCGLQWWNQRAPWQGSQRERQEMPATPVGGCTLRRALDNTCTYITMNAIITNTMEWMK